MSEWLKVPVLKMRSVIYFNGDKTLWNGGSLCDPLHVAHKMCIAPSFHSNKHNYNLLLLAVLNLLKKPTYDKGKHNLQHLDKYKLHHIHHVLINLWLISTWCKWCRPCKQPLGNGKAGKQAKINHFTFFYLIIAFCTYI